MLKLLLYCGYVKEFFVFRKYIRKHLGVKSMIHTTYSQLVQREDDKANVAKC